MTRKSSWKREREKQNNRAKSQQQPNKNNENCSIQLHSTFALIEHTILEFYCWFSQFHIYFFFIFVLYFKHYFLLLMRTARRIKTEYDLVILEGNSISPSPSSNGKFIRMNEKFLIFGMFVDRKNFHQRQAIRTAFLLEWTIYWRASGIT